MYRRTAGRIQPRDLLNSFRRSFTVTVLVSLGTWFKYAAGREERSFDEKVQLDEFHICLTREVVHVVFSARVDLRDGSTGLKSPFSWNIFLGSPSRRVELNVNIPNRKLSQWLPWTGIRFTGNDVHKTTARNPQASHSPLPLDRFPGRPSVISSASLFSKSYRFHNS
jgi:hypothetical protein